MSLHRVNREKDYCRIQFIGKVTMKSMYISKKVLYNYNGVYLEKCQQNMYIFVKSLASIWESEEVEWVKGFL